MNVKVKVYLRWALFSLTAIMMLGFPSYQIYSYEKILNQGTAYRLECKPYDPYDPFSGRYVAINPSVDYPEGGSYYSRDQWIQITKDKKGRLKVVEVTDTRPKEGDYLPAHFEYGLRKFYMNEKLAPIADKATRNLRDTSENALPCELEIMVLNGRAVSKELYINNIPIVKYCKNYEQYKNMAPVEPESTETLNDTPPIEKEETPNGIQPDEESSELPANSSVEPTS